MIFLEEGAFTGCPTHIPLVHNDDGDGEYSDLEAAFTCQARKRLEARGRQGRCENPCFAICASAFFHKPQRTRTQEQSQTLYYYYGQATRLLLIRIPDVHFESFVQTPRPQNVSRHDSSRPEAIILPKPRRT